MIGYYEGTPFSSPRFRRETSHSVPSTLQVKKCTGKFDEVPQLETEILDLISQMNVDTRKKFKQNMWLERGSQAGERVFDDILKYLKNQPQKTTSRKRQNNNPFQRKNVHKSNFMDRIANVSGVRLKKKK